MEHNSHQQHRSQSFSAPPHPQHQLHPQHAHMPQQQQAQTVFPPPTAQSQTIQPAPLSARSSPFASGPVAMVNQQRPGFSAPGQFPGVAVRTAPPTQLSTPLVSQRRSTSPLDRMSSEPLSSSNHSASLHESSAAPNHQQSMHAGYTSSPPAQQQQQHPTQYGVPADLFGGPDPLPPFQVGNANAQQLNLFPPSDHSPAMSLFGVPAAPTPPGRLSQKSSYENLFGTADHAVPGGAVSTITPPGSVTPMRSSQSFSYGQQQQQQQQQMPPPLTREDQPPRLFGAPPPPAAPFLGYADPTRSQSFRSAQSGASDARTVSGAVSSGVTAPSPTQPRTGSQRSSSGMLVIPPPLRIHVEPRSSDDLVDEFMRMSVDEQTQIGAASAAPPTKLMLADIPDTVSSLEGLYKQKRWRTLTKKSLSMLQNPSNDPRVTLEIKSWWLAGLIKDGHYDNATSVLHQIGDLNDPQYLRASDGSGDAFVLIRLRLLEALLSKCKGNVQDHEKKLFQLVAQIQRAAASGRTQEELGVSLATAAKWLRIVQFTLVNHLLHQHKFALVLRVCSTIETDSLAVGEQVVIASRLGRVHLQMGDLQTAEKFFSLARSVAATSAQFDARLLLNDGLLLFAQNKLQEALSAFDAVLEISRSSAPPSSDSDEALFLEEDLVCAAVNNYAICALYCCDVRGAVAALERMIRSDPARFLNAVVVFNLSSLYDLVFDNPTSTGRKDMMRRIAEMYDLEHIDPAAFRI